MAERAVESLPTGAMRPFRPIDGEPAERIAHALESLAVSLAALDHNLEVLIDRMPRYR